jgi:hypothetical protein
MKLLNRFDVALLTVKLEPLRATDMLLVVSPIGRSIIMDTSCWYVHTV